MGFFAELRRRHVYTVGAAYAVVGWLAIQVATQVFPFFQIPNWGVRLVVVLVLGGFPIALLLAWVFEITPEGIKREGEIDGNRRVVSMTGRKLTLFVVLAGLMAGGLMANRFVHSRHAVATQKSSPRSAGIESKSIAVLPFANLSAEKANSYFADGIQDEILTRLSKIADLKVISRTSTQHYQSTPTNLSEIARQLGVAHILEGSVQKVGTRARIHVQLIEAAHNSYIWADSYDRSLTDVFSVESEVAVAIADQLQARLTGREAKVIAARPTDSPEAYDAYLRGLAFNLKTANSAANSRGAQKHFEKQSNWIRSSPSPGRFSPSSTRGVT